jgi:hypothetical protein
VAQAAEAPPSAQPQTPAAVPEAAPVQPEPSVAKTPSRTTKRVTLGAADIQRVVSRNQKRIMTCFDQFKLASKPVGRCLEKQLERLRFPVHRDKEISVVLPVAYRVTR